MLTCRRLGVTSSQSWRPTGQHLISPTWAQTASPVAGLAELISAVISVATINRVKAVATIDQDCQLVCFHYKNRSYNSQKPKLIQRVMSIATIDPVASQALKITQRAMIGAATDAE